MPAMARTTGSRRRTDPPVLRLAAGVLVITLFVFLLAGLSLRQGRAHHQQLAFVSAQNLAQVLAQSIDDLIEKIDLGLLNVKDEAERAAAGGAVDKASLDRFIARQLARLPELMNIRVTDRQGVITYGVFEPGVAGKSLAHRDYFTRLRDTPKAGLVISSPVVGMLSGQWVLILARRVERPDGSFDGVVFGSIPLEFLGKLLGSVDVGAHGGISLRDAEMGIIARHPAPKDPASIVGNKSLSPELRQRLEAGEISATFFTPASWDNVPKVVSYRKVPGDPLYVAVGIATEDYLASWRDESIKMLVLVALFLAVVLGFAWLIRHELVRRRTKAEEVLEQTRQRLTLLFRQSMMGVIEWDAHFRVRFWNPAAEKIFGYARDEAMGRLGSDLILPGADGGDAEGAWNQFLRRSGGAYTSENVTKRGEAVTCEWFNSPIVGEDGSVGGLISFVSDVTDRKRAEEALRSSEKRLRDITSSLGEGVYALDREGRLTFMNPEAERLLGWTEAELRGRGLHQAIHGQRRDGTGTPLEEQLEHRVLTTGERCSSRDEVLLRKDGTSLPVFMDATPFQDGGQVVGTVTAFIDLTERKRVEQEREELIFQLQKALAEIKTLHGILPICSSCKKIRDEEGAWHQLEAYLSAHTDTLFSHGLCKDCAKSLYPDCF